MRYFAEFATTGERLVTYVADGMPYTVEDILLKHPKAIEISEEDQALYLQGYIRGTNGRPTLNRINDTDASNVELARNNKIEEIRELAKVKLVSTDHNIVEYLELHNLTDEQYENLKQQRQAVRELRDSLINVVMQLNNVAAIEAVEFK